MIDIHPSKELVNRFKIIANEFQKQGYLLEYGRSRPVYEDDVFFESLYIYPIGTSTSDYKRRSICVVHRFSYYFLISTSTPYRRIQVGSQKKVIEFINNLLEEVTK